MLIVSIFILLLIFLVGMTLIEIIAVDMRLIGAYYGLPMIGNHLSTVILLGSRVFTALILLIVGYLSDSGVATSNLSLIYFIASIFVVLILFILLQIPNFLTIQYYVGLSVFHPNKKVDEKNLEDHLKSSHSILSMALVIVGIFSYLGFLLPSIMASLFNDYRAVLLQTGFVFNVVATIMNALIIEKDIATICETGDKDSIAILILKYNYSKGVGIALSGVIFGLITILYTFF